MKKAIVILTSVFLVSLFFACNSEGAKETAETTNNESKKISEKEALAEATFTVHGSCGMCKTRIEKAAQSVEA